MKRYLIVVAGGTGTRMAQPVAKQFLLLEGLPLMWWTLRRFRAALPDLHVVLVLHESLFDTFRSLEATHGPAGVDQLVAGGAERWHSVANGLAVLPEDGVVGVHDAVRPFVSEATICRCFEAAADAGSAVPVVPVKDSIREVNGAASHALMRDRLRAVQTPQCFSLAGLKAAYSSGFRPEFTDDASVFEFAGHPVQLVDGDLENIKITTPEDLYVAQAFLREQRKGQ
ncbi:MAG: 2-C-methyl-D-erythritol 4-phosphate cytidylyltransferase [Bacteroidota bacterium]|nr:2-C-methyl-D-erythritol 4-phosphate cytidylyltransferase [Bacteroidota bacterium]